MKTGSRASGIDAHLGDLADAPMVRIVKSPEARRAELLDAAGRLFAELGYVDTSVDAIVRAASVAKGTFYYYFRTKEDVLDALVRRTAEKMAAKSAEIAERSDLAPVEKLRLIFRAQRGIEADDHSLVEHMHLPQNREVHARSNTETVRLLAPIMATVVAEGVEGGVFELSDPLSTVQFILAGSLALFDKGTFDWSPSERLERLVAMVALSERALGARPGTLGGLLEDANQAG